MFGLQEEGRVWEMDGKQERFTAIKKKGYCWRGGGIISTAPVVKLCVHTRLHSHCLKQGGHLCVQLFLLLCQVIQLSVNGALSQRESQQVLQTWHAHVHTHC